MSKGSNCPRCAVKLTHAERRGMVLELCPECRGTWCDAGELTVLIELYKRLEPGEGVGGGVFCVRCDVELRELRFPGTSVSIDVCPECQGTWLDGGELKDLRDALERVVGQDQPDLAVRAKSILDEFELAGQQRFRCPKCEAKLWHIHRGGTIVELCSGCSGMWFDGGELSVLLGVYRRLDPASGTETAFKCLRCGDGLRELTYPKTGVALDVCPGCTGVWLDKGEFEDLKEQVRDLVETEEPNLAERAVEILDDLDRGASQRMACPRCSGRIEEGRASGVRAEVCASCEGTWLDAGDLMLALGVSRKIKLKDGEPGPLRCIRCPDQVLVEIDFPGTEVPIDICPDCRGSWLDRDELAGLRKAIGL
ncbi:MAG: zf-TFIIB domain-containing protein [Planctomycetes bacterium]|nr:zf-TFIIB domain-containing protein [Planctomycetota bacterium]